MKIHSKQQRLLKYFVFPLLLISLFTFKANTPVPVKAATIITTKASESYINDYYSSIGTSLTGSALASALETRLKAERKASFSYGSLQTNAFPYTDADPTRPNDGYIVSFYSGKAVKGYSGMNKEHTWPNSHGGNKIENDPHMVRPTISSENSSRGNEYFSNTAAGWDPAELGDLQARGMAARIALYGAVIGKSGGLVLEDVGRGQGSGTGNKMGKLGDLLKWNLEYPVNAKEILRNETLDISLNYNRNPFIDRPEYACQIWGDTNDNTRSICAAATPVEVTSISIDPSYGTINLLSAAKTVQLNANILPTNASNKSVNWSSSNASVASVSTSGLVTGLSVGQATIFATSASNPSKVAQASIQVLSAAIPVTGVSLNKATTSIEVGKIETLVATVLPSGATNKTVTWTSSNNSVASVSNGVVSAIKKGSTTISVKTNDGNFSASTLVNVVAAAPATFVTANFYFSTNSNNGGESGVTVANINNGMSGSNSIAGFGGKQVISSVVTTAQAYLPRGGGLALGSSGSAGSAKITLNNDYKTTKIEVLINASVSGATASLATNITPKSNVAGKNGAEYSNPNSSSYTGTYYTLEFNEPHNYFEINTTKRMVVVEIRLTIGGAPVVETPTEEAESWSTDFLVLTDSGCLASNRNMLQNAWNEAAEGFNELSNDAQLIIKNTAAEYSEEIVIKHAKARYVVIKDNYGFYDFIAGEDEYGNKPEYNPLTNNLTVFIIIFLLGTISFNIYFFLKKRTKKTS